MLLSEVQAQSIAKLSIAGTDFSEHDGDNNTARYQAKWSVALLYQPYLVDNLVYLEVEMIQSPDTMGHK